MQAPAQAAASPLLPRPLAVPLSLLPGPAHSRMLALLLNRMLATPLREGMLDFLRHRVVAVDVRDAGIRWTLSLRRGMLCPAPSHSKPDLLISATVHDFLSLAGRQVDPDTLVFQRRLVMQGDTELGLQVKNCLDSLDDDALWMYAPLESLLQKVIPLYQRVFS